MLRPGSPTSIIPGFFRAPERTAPQPPRDNLNIKKAGVLWACNELVRRGIAQVVNRNTLKKFGINFPQSPINGRIDIRA